ncbi:hypothetical protein AC578_6846 [Pseudocercospora eumusae]|uniref:Uncharacterized protein n=1 Tax=Pseudocercospora eumusae TaxID=321146 RepID=A0A139H7F6_9PEZI|nr:hypothetical protein AC578_6846 [Pseudocercospora eumusae]
MLLRALLPSSRLHMHDFGAAPRLEINPACNQQLTFLTTQSATQINNISLFAAMASLSAGARVAGTTELLEAILLNLNHDEIDLKTLLVSQRTSTAFRNTIQGSLKLRQALYLEPPTTLRGHSEVWSGMNPLLRYAGIHSWVDGGKYGSWKLQLPFTSDAKFHLLLSQRPHAQLEGMHSFRVNSRAIPPPVMPPVMPSWTRMYVFQWHCTVGAALNAHPCDNPRLGDFVPNDGPHYFEESFQAPPLRPKWGRARWTFAHA